MTVADFSKRLKIYKKTLEALSARELKEADTVFHFGNFLSDVLGYDKISEISREFAIRSTYCDYAVKIKDKIAFLVELKAMPVELKEAHLRQTVNYAMNAGAEWCLLTNLKEFYFYHVEFTKPIDKKLVFSVNLLNDDLRQASNLLHYLAKDSFKKGEVGKYWLKISALSNQNLAAALLSPESVRTLKRVIKKNTGANPEERQIAEAVRNLFDDSLHITISSKRQSRTKSQDSALNKKSSESKQSIPEQIDSQISDSIDSAPGPMGT